MSLDTRQLTLLRSIRDHVRDTLGWLDECEKLALDPAGYAARELFPPTARGLIRTAASHLHIAADRLGDLGRELP